MGKASAFFGLLAVALLAYGGYRYAVDAESQTENAVVDPHSSSASPLRVIDPDKDVAEKPCADMRVHFRVQNTSARPVRIVGFTPCCRENCCLEPVCMDPFILPAGGEREIECIAHAGKAGPFQCPVSIVYHDGDYQVLEVSVRGTWVQPTPVLPRPRAVDSH